MDIIEFLVNGVVIMILIHVGLNLMTWMVKRRADSDLDEVSNDLELERLNSSYRRGCGQSVFLL